jgi:hypothetical protein
MYLLETQGVTYEQATQALVSASNDPASQRQLIELAGTQKKIGVFGRGDFGYLTPTMGSLPADVTDNPPRPLAVNAAAQSEYARLSGKPVAALRQAMETWLPIAIVRYFLLMGGPTSDGGG